MGDEGGDFDEYRTYRYYRGHQNIFQILAFINIILLNEIYILQFNSIRLPISLGIVKGAFKKLYKQVSLNSGTLPPSVVS